MPLHGNGWRPTRVTRFIRSIGSATRTAQVDTDIGEGYLKALGNPEGPHSLACELVGSLMAEWLGLTTLDFALVEVKNDDEIPFFDGGKALPGPAFISRADPLAIPWGGEVRDLHRVVNHLEISGLVVLDTWILNCDRHAPDGRRVNRDNVLLSQVQGTSGLRLTAMDFTHAFTCGGDITRRISHIERRHDEKIYGLFKEFEGFLNRDEVKRLAGVLGRITPERANEFIRMVPNSWEVDVGSRTAWATLLVDRARFLSENIEQILWPQLELEGGTQ